MTRTLGDRIVNALAKLSRDKDGELRQMEGELERIKRERDKWSHVATGLAVVITAHNASHSYSIGGEAIEDYWKLKEAK